jgi:hypothetical protein
MRRAALIWLVLFAAYAATLGLDSFDASDYGGDEPHYLLAAESLVGEGDIDLRDEYAQREYSDFYPHELDPHGTLTSGRLHEPHGAGFPMLIAPAFALAGADGVEVFLAALAALAFALGYLLAVRVAPDPWASGATLAIGLSPPALAYGSAVYPELVAGAIYAGAGLCVAAMHESPRRRYAFGCFALLGLLPWLGTKYVLVGVVIGVLAARVLIRRGRGTLALVGAEVAGFSVALYVSVNDALYGGITPYSADVVGETATDADFPLGYLERSYRLVALWIDRDYGLVRWAPVIALCFLGAWLFYRTRREGLGRIVPEHLRAEAVAGLCLAACAAQVAVAAFLAPTMFGFWFPGRHVLAALPLGVPLAAWGLRRVPRAGAALALIGVAASVWLYADVRAGDGGLAAAPPDAPWGPLEAAFPLFDGSALPNAVAVAAGAAALALLLVDARHWRQIAGATRTKYSG